MDARAVDRLQIVEAIKNSFCIGCDNYNGLRCRACNFDDALDVIDSVPMLDLKAIRELVPQWISVKDRLPTGEDPVLILVKETEHYGYNKEKRKVYYCQYLAYWDGDEWFTTWCNGCRKISDTAKEPYADDYEVTHWMPLPEAPKEE